MSFKVVINGPDATAGSIWTFVNMIGNTVPTKLLNVIDNNKLNDMIDDTLKVSVHTKPLPAIISWWEINR